MKDLTKLERRVILKVCRGLDYEEIAKSECKTPGSIRKTVRRVCKKLSAKTTAHAVAIFLGFKGGGGVQRDETGRAVKSAVADPLFLLENAWSRQRTNP